MTEQLELRLLDVHFDVDQDGHFHISILGEFENEGADAWLTRPDGEKLLELLQRWLKTP